VGMMDAGVEGHREEKVFRRLQQADGRVLEGTNERR